MSGQERVDKTTCERSRAEEHAMRLLILELFRHLHGLRRKNLLYALESDKVLGWSAAEKFYFADPPLPLVFATRGDDTARPLESELPAKSSAEVAELDDDGNVVLRKAFSGVKVCVVQ